jgi:hypothetical protein
MMLKALRSKLTNGDLRFCDEGTLFNERGLNGKALTWCCWILGEHLESVDLTWLGAGETTGRARLAAPVSEARAPLCTMGGREQHVS